MKRSAWMLGMVSLAAGALWLTPGAMAKDQVTRPFKWSGQNVIVADMSPMYGNPPSPVVPWWIQEESGQATHVGHYTCVGGGTIDMSTGVFTGEGYLRAANGDLIFWRLEHPYTLTITGGTGRFANATGVWIGVSTEIGSEQAGTLLFLQQINGGTGTITY